MTGPRSVRARRSRRPPPVPSVRWSLFTVGDNLPAARHRPYRPAEILRYVQEAERLGYWAFFFAEHHFDAHGEIPDPWLLVAAAAERTRRGSLRLGPMVSNLAFRHPVQVAEQALLANAVSEGRVEVGVGSGNIPQEHVAFGLYPDPIARKRAAFDAAVPTFLSVLAGQDVRAPGLPAGVVRVEIGPSVTPAARVWFAVSRPEVAVRYASQGHSVALGPPFATMADLSQLADAVRAVRQGVGVHSSPRIAAAFPTYVGPEPEVALAALDDFVGVKTHDGALHLPPGAPPTGPPTSSKALVERGLALVGRPEHVARQIEAVAATGITDLFAIPDFGGLSPDRVVRSLRALAALVHLPVRPGRGSTGRS